MEISIVHQQQQAMSCHGLEELLIGCPNPPPPPPPPEKKPRSQPEPALKCPRCSSTNTKFCYYNNYSLSQPRHFCKGCRRYWTKGGTLRNVPVGGGCRKNRRSSSSSSASYSHGDLTVAFARQLWPPLADHQQFFLQNPNPNPNPNPNGGFLDLMRNGTFLESSNSINGSNGSVVQMPIGVDGAMAMEYSSLHALLNI